MADVAPVAAVRALGHERRQPAALEERRRLLHPRRRLVHVALLVRQEAPRRALVRHVAVLRLQRAQHRLHRVVARILVLWRARSSARKGTQSAAVAPGG